MAKVVFAGLDFSAKLGYLSYNFGSRNARKPIKGSEDSNYTLISNTTLDKKIGVFV